MGKEFNITGTCIPEMHYMVDTSNKLGNVIELIDKGKYFIINRPRQYGKTTTLFLLYKQLRNNDDYIAIKTSFEGIGDLIFEDEEVFSREFLDILADSLYMEHEELAEFLKDQKQNVEKFKAAKITSLFLLKFNYFRRIFILPLKLYCNPSISTSPYRSGGFSF